MTRLRAARTLPAGGLVVAVTLTLAACTGGLDDPPRPDPAPVADAFAQGLASGDFTKVGFSGTTPKAVHQEYAATVAGLGDRAPQVSVARVASTGAKGAEATLDWTWSFDGKDWTYTTTAPLLLSGDSWRVEWDVAEIEPSLIDHVVLDATTLDPERGRILGADGVALVRDRPVVRFGIDRTAVPASRAGDSALALARLVGIDPTAYAKRVRAAGPKAFIEAIVLRAGDVSGRISQQYPLIKGAVGIHDTLPLAPTKEFAAPILGSVGEVTAEMIKDHPDTYQAGDVAGLSGLQQRYDGVLRGTPGVVVDAVGTDDKARTLFRVPPVAGKPPRLTLDEGMQEEAERLLAGVKPASAIVAIRPSDGAILAAANGPGNNGYNMATYGQFAPGSTFKSVSSLALLRAGLTPDTTVPCTPTITVDGKVFKNYSDYPAGGIGRIPLRTALANSCNTAFISQRDRLGDSDLADAAAALGMGVDHDLGFPAYFGNVVPAASDTEAAADMIGQGKVLASPMVMATVIASIEAGRTVVPQLVRSVTPPKATPSTPLTGGEAATLRSMLRGVVTGGSGALLADVPGPPVIAKTGTAEFERNGRVLTHAWMIAAQGDLAVAVFVDEGSSGSGTAGPLLESFLRSTTP